MSRLSILLLACVLPFPLQAPAARGADVEPAAAARPNVVLVITDDQRYDTLGCTGHPAARTPNIDRLAREGVLFRRFYVATPLCSVASCFVRTCPVQCSCVASGGFTNRISLRS